MKIQFDTRNKKPHLYWLLLPAAAAAAAEAIFMILDVRRFALPACAVTAAFCVTALIWLLWALRAQMEYNLYSYNTIYYTGFALFTLFVLITYLVLTVRLIVFKDAFDVRAVFSLLLGSAKNYVLITSPFLLAFSAALCISNLALIKHEGKRPVNFLGILLSVLLIAGAVFIFVFDFAASGSQTQVMIRDLITNFIAALYLYFECMLIGTIFADAVASRRVPGYDRDFMIILGCALRKDGTPSPILRGRIDRAIAFAEEQEKRTGKKLIFVTSGGKGSDEIHSESRAMKDYLLSRGIPEERILEEDRSTDTFENMKFSKIRIGETDPNGKIAFCTTNYHVFRSGVFARRVKMKAVGLGAGTKWYFWPNAAVREFAALLTQHRGKQALVLCGMIAFFVLITVLAYRT